MSHKDTEENKYFLENDSSSLMVPHTTQHCGIEFIPIQL